VGGPAVGADVDAATVTVAPVAVETAEETAAVSTAAASAAVVLTVAAYSSFCAITSGVPAVAETPESAMALVVMVSRSATVNEAARAAVAVSLVVAAIVALTCELSKLRRRETDTVHERLEAETPVFAATPALANPQMVVFSASVGVAAKVILTVASSLVTTFSTAQFVADATLLFAASQRAVFSASVGAVSNVAVTVTVAVTEAAVTGDEVVAVGCFVVGARVGLPVGLRVGDLVVLVGVRVGALVGALVPGVGDLLVGDAVGADDTGLDVLIVGAFEAIVGVLVVVVGAPVLEVGALVLVVGTLVLVVGALVEEVGALVLVVGARVGELVVVVGALVLVVGASVCADTAHTSAAALKSFSMATQECQ
jgi:elastin